MKKFNIPKIKFPKIKSPLADMDPDVKYAVKGISKLLLGLCILGAAIKGCNSGCHAMDQRKKAQEEADKKIPATLINKDRSGGMTMFYLDLDGNPATTEAVAMSGMSLQKAAQFHDMTNGTVKSVAEWKKIAGIPQYFTYTK